MKEKYIDYSVIIPFYNEEENLKILYEELNKVFYTISYNSCEFIFVDDGSTDNGNEVISQISKKDKRVKVITHYRNYGQTAALSDGLSLCSGNIVITIDADLEIDSEYILKLLKYIPEFDAVLSVRKNRWKKKLFSRRIPSIIANSIIRVLSGVKLHDFGSSLKVIKREYLRDLRLFGEMHRFLGIYLDERCAKIIEIDISQKERLHGKSKYGSERVVRVLFDLLTIVFLMKYSERPLYFFGLIGIVFFFIGTTTGLFTIIRHYCFNGIWLSPMLIISLIFFSTGIIIFLLGLMTEILIRIYWKTKDNHRIKSKRNL